MKKIVRIMDSYGINKEIEVDSSAVINKEDTVCWDYRQWIVTEIRHSFDEMTTYYICEQE